MARDAEDAVQIAIQIGHMRVPNRKPIVDLTERLIDEPGIKELMDQGFRGRLMKKLPSSTWEDVVRNRVEQKKQADRGKWLPMVLV